MIFFIVVGYVYVFLIGLLAVQLIQPYFASSETPESTQLGIMVIPPFAFYRGLYALTRAVSFNGPGMSIAEMTDTFYRLDLVFYFLVGEVRPNYHIRYDLTRMNWLVRV